MYIPLTCLTDGSHCYSQTKAEDIPKICDALNIPSIALTDINNISQCYYYHTAMKNAGKKPIIGMQLDCCLDFASIKTDNPIISRVVILAKNYNGWKSLLKIVYESNDPGIYQDGPRLSVKELVPLLNKDLICIINSKFTDEQIKDFKESSCRLVCGVDPINNTTFIKGLPTVPQFPNFYFGVENVEINRALLCKLYKVSLINASSSLNPAFEDDRYFIHNEDDIKKYDCITDQSIENTVRIFNEIEEYEIVNDQEFPNFSCPDGMDEKQYLRALCQEGWKIKDRQPGKDNEYIDRIKHELEVIGSAGMSGYFLVMADICRFCRENGIYMGAGRGSAGGCLISYLVGITDIDSIEFDLLFERFYSIDRADYADIDLDIQPSRRLEIVSYLKNKYGNTKVAQLTTFSALKGSAATKLALSTSKKNIPVDEQNEITNLFPKEYKISSELKDQDNELESNSTVLYGLLHYAEKFEKWCTIDSETLKCDGIYAEEFDMAIKLNSIFQARSRHASAFILSKKTLQDFVPLIYDVGSNSRVVGVDMVTAEKMGCVKLDLLSLTLLDEFADMEKVLNGDYSIQ